MGNTIIALLSLLKVKQRFISLMDHCDIYIKCLILITNNYSNLIIPVLNIKAGGKRDQ